MKRWNSRKIRCGFGSRSFPTSRKWWISGWHTTGHLAAFDLAVWVWCVDGGWRESILWVFPWFSPWVLFSWWCFKLVGGFKHFFCFYPCLGKIPILTNIFQVGWNHQPVKIVPWKITIIHHHLAEICFTEFYCFPASNKQIQVILSWTRKTCVCVAKNQDDKGSCSKSDEELWISRDAFQ